jgi:hypothetical protein
VTAKLLLRVELGLGWLSGRVLVWCWRLAMRRGDTHEANHCMAAIIAGNSNHKTDRWPCPLPASAFERAEVYEGFFTAGDPR